METGHDPEEGQLAVDVFQTEDEVVLKAPIAGVGPGDLDISITDEAITIRGERKNAHKVRAEEYLVQECYWGPFSRTYILPVQVIAEKANALLKEGILTISIPKDEKSKTKTLTVQAG